MHGGEGLDVNISIMRAERLSEFISDRLVKVALEVCGRNKTVTSVIATDSV